MTEKKEQDDLEALEDAIRLIAHALEGTSIQLRMRVLPLEVAIGIAEKGGVDGEMLDVMRAFAKFQLFCSSTYREQSKSALELAARCEGLRGKLALVKS